MAEDNENQDRVLARIIIELMGAPKEHLMDTVKNVIDAIKKDHELEVVSEETAEPNPHESMFTTFVEMEIWFKNLDKLFNFCFEAMPSSIEILEPTPLHITANDLSGYLNDMQARLHTLDMALKNLKSEKKVLSNNSDALLRNIVRLSVKAGPKSVEDISKDCGISKEDLKKILVGLADSTGIKEKEGKYVLESSD